MSTTQCPIPQTGLPCRSSRAAPPGGPQCQSPWASLTHAARAGGHRVLPYRSTTQPAWTAVGISRNATHRRPCAADALKNCTMPITSTPGAWDQAPGAPVACRCAPNGQRVDADVAQGAVVQVLQCLCRALARNRDAAAQQQAAQSPREAQAGWWAGLCARWGWREGVKAHGSASVVCRLEGKPKAI